VNPSRVIFVSSSVGAGHNQAAAALIAGLKAEAPALQTEFIDALEYIPWWFRCVYAGGYETMVTKFPRLYGLGYNLNNRSKTARRSIAERLRLSLEFRVLARLRKYLLRKQPTLIMATHYLAMPMIGRLIREGLIDSKMLAVITDNEAHRFWYSENVERWFVANEAVGLELQHDWDVVPDRITVSGIPVHPKWTHRPDKAKVRRNWSLPADGPIVLLSGGAYFTVGPIERIARRLIDETNAHVVALAGSNKKLLARLSRMPESPERLTPVPMTDRLNDLAGIADVMVTKAGGLMTSECVASGTAMVLTKPVPGQETANAKLLAHRGAAVIAPTSDEIIAQVRRLLLAPAEIESLRKNGRSLYKPATETIVSHILEKIVVSSR
jgi:processive 1,2-diacylglycerol beta-glucosyltransferase